MALLEVRDLRKSFGGVVASDGLSLDIPEGGLAGLIGPNGAGKTTAFNLITGLYRPDSGSIRLNGEELAGLPAYVIASRRVSRTFQNIRLFTSLSVLDNVVIGCHRLGRTSVADALFATNHQRNETRVFRERAFDVLRYLGLERLAAEKAGNLPYGEQRRLEIARALAADPVLLLLDEPASGMNPQETQELMGLVRRIRDERRVSVLLIEHDMRFVMGICERITVLDYGKILAEGAPEEIRTDPRVIEAYLGEAPV